VGELLRVWGDTSGRGSFWHGLSPPGVYACLGIVASLCGFTRCTVAIVICVAEVTGDLSLLVPSLFAAVLARAVAGWVTPESYVHGLMQQSQQAAQSEAANQAQGGSHGIAAAAAAAAASNLGSRRLDGDQGESSEMEEGGQEGAGEEVSPARRTGFEAGGRPPWALEPQARAKLRPSKTLLSKWDTANPPWKGARGGGGGGQRKFRI